MHRCTFQRIKHELTLTSAAGEAAVILVDENKHKVHEYTINNAQKHLALCWKAQLC